MTDAMIKVKVLEHQTDIILQKVLQKFCGMAHVLNLGQIQSTKIRNGLIFDEFEIGEVIDCVFTYYNKPYLLKCEIISISIAQNSQQTQSNAQFSLRSNKESQKRVRPESCIIETPQLVKKNLNEKPTTSQAPLCSKDIMNFQSDDFANVNSDDEGDSKSSEEEINPNLDKSKKLFKIRKIKPKEKRQEIIIDLSRETDVENDYSVEKIILLLRHKMIFEKYLKI